MMMLDGHVTCGGVVSTTVTVKVQVFVPAAFEAVEITLVVPSRKPLPLGGVEVTATGPEASEAVTVKLTGVRPPVHSATMFVGQFKVGKVTVLVGVTVIEKLHELLLPELSIAVAVTVVVPTGKVLPELGEASKLAMPHASEAAAV